MIHQSIWCQTVWCLGAFQLLSATRSSTESVEAVIDGQNISPLLCQSVVCGEGVRYRNLSCFVSDGSADGDFIMVDEELCSDLELAVNGDEQIHLKEPCTLPCPGKTAGILAPVIHQTPPVTRTEL